MSLAFFRPCAIARRLFFKKGICFFTVVSGEEAAMAERQDAQEVKSLIDRYCDAYRHRDIDSLSDVIANDPQFVAFGSDEGETWLGWEEFRSASEKLFGAIRELHWNRGTPVIRFSRDGTVAWFTEELSACYVSANEKGECSFRFSGVAEKRSGGWVFVQFHRSVPVKGYAVPYLETHGVRFD
jgi:uncharacterized protein (TIGR02246 family)